MEKIKSSTPEFLLEILIGGAAVICLSLTGVLLYFSNRGFDLMDESFNLLMYRYPTDYLHLLYFHSLFISPIYYLLGENIQALRITHLLINLCTSSMLVYAVTVFLKKEIRLSRKEFLCILCFTLCGANHSIHERIPNYNTISYVCGSLILSVVLLRLGDQIRSNRTFVGMLSVLFSIEVLNKSTSGLVLLWLCAILYWRFSGIRFSKLIGIFFPVLLISFVMAFATGSVASGSPQNFLRNYTIGFSYNQIAGLDDWNILNSFYFLPLKILLTKWMVVLVPLWICKRFLNINGQWLILIALLAFGLLFYQNGTFEYDDYTFHFAWNDRFNVLFFAPSAVLACLVLSSNYPAKSIELILLLLLYPLAIITLSFAALAQNLFGLMDYYYLAGGLIMVLALRNAMNWIPMLLSISFLVLAIFCTLSFQIMESQRVFGSLTDQNLYHSRLKLWINQATEDAMTPIPMKENRNILTIGNYCGIAYSARAKPEISTILLSSHAKDEFDSLNRISNLYLAQQIPIKQAPDYVVVRKGNLKPYASLLNANQVNTNSYQSITIQNYFDQMNPDAEIRNDSLIIFTRIR